MVYLASLNETRFSFSFNRFVSLFDIVGNGPKAITGDKFNDNIEDATDVIGGASSSAILSEIASSRPSLVRKLISSPTLSSSPSTCPLGVLQSADAAHSKHPESCHSNCRASLFSVSPSRSIVIFGSLLI